jgi:hypothetical protein
MNKDTKELLLLLEKSDIVEKLKKDKHKLKSELELLKRKYVSSEKANNNLIRANTRLVDENKYLKRDIARIKDVLEYLDYCKEDNRNCRIDTIKDLLVGIKKENLDNTL